MKTELLHVSGLEVTFQVKYGVVSALSDFSCTLNEGETIAVIGESGSGKSVAAHAIMRILPNNATIGGKIMVCGRNIESLSENEMNGIRGTDIGILFQSPDRSLNPLYRIERQILEPLWSHDRPVTSDQAINLLRQVGFQDPREILDKFPCQCSGGMNQRALLAEVLGLHPRIFIADEPTKGLDKSRITEVADSLRAMRSARRGIMIITHDIPLARSLSDIVKIMYAGEVVESGISHEVFSSPYHPYTRSLFKSLPENGFIPIPGMSPALSDLPKGCRFAPRCSLAIPECHVNHQAMNLIHGREVRCPRCL